MPQGPPVGVGIIGCGDVFDRYAHGMARFRPMTLVACADIDPAQAQAAAVRTAIPAAGTVEELLANPAVHIAVILTPPATHSALVTKAIEAGKSVYVEKPVTTNLNDGIATLELARERGVEIACAPDTFLGAACQTARAIVDSGELGEVFGASLFVTHNHLETRHPDPTFLFRPGGGPVLDLGPYYLTQLVACLGPVSEVMGRTRIGHRQRIITSPNRRVDVVDVEVPTHAAAVLEFGSGVLATVMVSYDVFARSVPWIEINGTRGQLQLPDPNVFDGAVRLFHNGGDWETVAPGLPELATPGSPEALWRGLGVADLASGLSRRPPRAGAELGLHVFESLEAIQLASDSRETVRLATSCSRPQPLGRAEFEAWLNS